MSLWDIAKAEMQRLGFGAKPVEGVDHVLTHSIERDVIRPILDALDGADNMRPINRHTDVHVVHVPSDNGVAYSTERLRIAVNKSHLVPIVKAAIEGVTGLVLKEQEGQPGVFLSQPVPYKEHGSSLEAALSYVTVDRLKDYIEQTYQAFGLAIRDDFGGNRVQFTGGQTLSLKYSDVHVHTPSFNAPERSTPGLKALNEALEAVTGGERAACVAGGSKQHLHPWQMVGIVERLRDIDQQRAADGRLAVGAGAEGQAMNAAAERC